MKIPYAKPEFTSIEKEFVLDAVNSTWVSGGPYIDAVEYWFSTEFNRKALTVSNGTTAIHLAFLALELQPGDEVIVPGFAFMAAANICMHMHLKPVFVEVDKDTYCITADSIEEKITNKTKAIVAIHTYGNLCDMNSILDVAGDIPIIEDCAESIFSRYCGEYCGSFGKIATFSFHSTKTIYGGEGGLITTRDKELYKRMVAYRSHGLSARGNYQHEVPGHNFRLTNLQAALIYGQLERVNSTINERKRVQATYTKLFNLYSIKMQKFNSEVDPVVWAVAIEIDNRDEMIIKLKDAGIESRPGFVASSLLPYFDKHSVPVSEHISRRVLSLPTYPSLKNEEVGCICEILRKGA